MIDELDRITEIFMPALPPARERMRNGYKLIHYTSVETAELILKTKRFRLSDTRHMNDKTEISHGLGLVASYLSKGDDALFLRGLSELFPMLPAQVRHILMELTLKIEAGVYASCVSEHSPSDDENGGRLSMWWMYGAGARGAAFVLEPAPFWSRTNALNAYSTPVLYGGRPQFEEYADRIGQNILDNLEFLRTLPAEQILSSAMIPVLFAALSTKATVFNEEREWRVVHVPRLWPSKVLEPVELAPNRRAYDVPLVDRPDEGLTGINPDDLLVKLIIGPANVDQSIFDRLLMAMREAGIQSPETRLIRSPIPLRA